MSRVTAVTDRLVGREREIAALRAWLDEAREGSGHLVLCSGEPGIGKTRLAQELAGAALAAGTPVAWGRCVEAEGAPALWPWRQVLRSLGLDPDAALAGDVESPQERFRLFESVSDAVRSSAQRDGLLIVLDDIHWGDEPSVLVLRHLAGELAGTRLLVVATFRLAEPASVLPRVLPDLIRTPAATRLDLRGLDLDGVREQLGAAASAAGGVAGEVLDLTAGNPLFVREVARAMADGTWRPDRPPRSVLDVVAARLERISPDCRRLVQAAAIAGRDFTAPVVAATLGEPVPACLPLLDEAVAHGLVDQVGGAGDYRFVHALTREAVEASLTTADRLELHRAVAAAIEAHFAGDPADRLASLARHWGLLAPYGEAATARRWTVLAADEAVRRLAFEEAVRLYRAALDLDPAALTSHERSKLLIALGRAASFAGDLQSCLNAAEAAAEAGGRAGDATLQAEAALVLEAAPDHTVNTVAKQLCEQALGAEGLDAATQPALRARLLAARSHLAYYDGDAAATETLSSDALALARLSGEQRALADALRARHEACPGPRGRAERLALASEMLDLFQRTGNARAAMWGGLWRIGALIEQGQLNDAYDELGPLQVAVGRVGGPVSAWHLDRTVACVAQAQGRFPEALDAGRRAFLRMRPIEPGPATGAYFSLLTILSTHIGVVDEALGFLDPPIQPLPRFRTMGAVSRARLLLALGRASEARAAFEEAGPAERWSLPAFFAPIAYVHGVVVAGELGRHDDVAHLLERLGRRRGEHATGEAVVYAGPVELALGRGAYFLGRLDAAVEDLTTAADRARRAGAPGFLAECLRYLATALDGRRRPGDREQADAVAREAERLARTLGMADGPATPAASPLSRREEEVALLVADGMTNRQIAQRLVIAERTAENHVQHILTKLGFTTRSQIAAWAVTRSRR